MRLEQTQSQCHRTPHAVAECRRYGLRVAAKKGGRTEPDANEQRCAAGLQRADGAGSANNTWFPRGLACKSLIVERTTATTYRRFATSLETFAIGVIFARVAAAPLSSLSKSLKEREKETEEERKNVHANAPRVEAGLPSISDAADFLGHASRESETPDTWQLMADEPFEINVLQPPSTLTMCPRLALRMALQESRQQDNQRRPMRCRRRGLT